MKMNGDVQWKMGFSPECSPMPRASAERRLYIRTSVNPPAASIAMLLKRSGFFCIPYVKAKFLMDDWCGLHGLNFSSATFS